MYVIKADQLEDVKRLTIENIGALRSINREPHDILLSRWYLIIYIKYDYKPYRDGVSVDSCPHSKPEDTLRFASRLAFEHRLHAS